MAEANENVIEEGVVEQEVVKEPEHITLTEKIDDKDVVTHYAISEMSEEAKGLFVRLRDKQETKNKLVNAFNSQIDDLVRVEISLTADLKKVLPTPVEEPIETKEDESKDAKDEKGESKPN